MPLSVQVILGESTCVVEGALENVRVLKCLQDTNDKKPVKMDYAHSVWFHKVTKNFIVIIIFLNVSDNLDYTSFSWFCDTLESSNSSTSGKCGS